MKRQCPHTLKVMIVLLTISITMMAHSTTHAASQFYTPQKKAEVPEWFKIFDRSDSQPVGAQRFTPAKSSSVAYPSAPSAPRSAGIAVAPVASGYRNSLLDRPAISIAAAAPVSAARTSVGSSAGMQIKETSQAVSRGRGSMMAMAGGSALSSTVYEPFNNTAPSEYSGGGYTPDIGGKRNFPSRPDDRPADASPIGEPWILLAFALLFGGWITLKKKHKLTDNMKNNTNDMKTFENKNTSVLKSLLNRKRAFIEGISRFHRANIEPFSRDNRVSSHRTILLFALIFIMGIGQMWGADASSANVYYDNTSSAWSDVQIFIGHSTWSVADGMTKLTNSNNLYYKRSYSWGGYSAFYFTTGASGWEGRGENVDTRVTYTTHYSAKKTDNLGSSTWLFISSGGSNGSSVSGSTITGYDELNYTQTVQQTLSADGGSTYSTSTASLATVKVASYYLSSATATSATATSGTISAGSSSANCKAVRTATVTYTVTGVATGYTFVGWYDGSTQKSTSTTYSYNATEAKTITARFKAEETHDVSISYKCGSTTIKTATTESAVGVTTARSITAPTIAGYTFSSWSKGDGITIKSGSTNTATISITSGASDNTLTANYTEDLSSPYVLKGGSAFGGTAWSTEFPLTKKAGHSTEDIAYYTATLSSTNNVENTGNDNFLFKIVNGSNWYGIHTDDNHSGSWWYFRASGEQTLVNHNTSDENIQLRADIAGDYEIKVDYTNPSALKITVTFPTVYTLTYAIGTLKGTSGSITSSPTTASGSSVLGGSTVTLTAPAAKTGYAWKGWYTNAAGTSAQQCATQAYAVTMNANKTLYACYQYASYTVTLDQQTGVTGYGSVGTVANPSVTYNTALPAISGTMPTAATGYGFMGFYTATGGSGEKIIDASGNWVRGVSGYTSADGKWLKTSGVTLYAYYTKPKITAITLTPAAGVVAPNGEISATPTIEPTPVGGGTMSVCWKLLYNNGNIYDPQPDMSISSNTVTFNMPENSGSYKLAAILHTGTGDCGTGTTLDSVTTNIQVAGDHQVTIQYKCGDEIIKASTVETGRPLTTTSVTAPDIFGYTFSKWKQGDGITITGADANGEKASKTIEFTAIYDGKLTAIYTQNSIIYFKNTLGWSSVYVNFYTENYWGLVGEDVNKGSGNAGVANRNKLMTQIDGTDIWYYDYGAAGITPTNFVSFTKDKQGDETNGYQWFWQTEVVFPSRYADAYSDEKAGENGFFAKTPMFVPIGDPYNPEINKWTLNNGGTIYRNAGYWTKYTPGTGYTLEVYSEINSVNVLVRSVEFTSEDDLMPMTATLDLEANHQYKFQVKRDGDVYYGNEGEMTYNEHGQSTPWEMINTMPSFTLARIYTNAAGDYTFTLSCAPNGDVLNPQYRLRMKVDYPIANGDYRLIYKDGVHTKWHPSGIVPKVANGKDTVSFFIRPKNASRVLKIQQASVNASTGVVTWSDYSTITSSITGLPQDSVYNINLKMDGSGAISVESVEPYTGKYYIRTDCANSKWDNYRSDPDHLMTYSEYSITHGGYSHYYCHWVQTDNRKNVKFTIANDYSPCISDTLTRETATGAWSNVASFITEGGDLLRDANVRFMWDQHTNTISRAYIDGAQGHANDFLVLVSADGKIKNSAGSQTLTEVKFQDNQNWIYEANVKAQPNAQIKLRSTWGESPTIVQYFKGTTSSTETLITGSGTLWYDIRLLYDFKTNRLVAAMLPSGNYDDPTPINADVMFIRDHQGDISQLTFTEDGTITDIETVYGVIQFNKWTLNNKERTGSHNPLSSPASTHERGLYFISFPFRVSLNEVFGFGKYGTHWIIQYYDGAERAAKGYWQGDPGFWKFIWDRKNVFLEPNQGYLLTLDLDELGEESSVWANNSERAELFFPSYGSLSTIANETVTKELPAHTCTINRAATEGLPDTPDNPHTSYNRTIFDSHWNVMGVPTYVNTAAQSFANTSWITATVDHKTQGPNFLYTWNTDDNTLTPTSGATFKYHAMHAYMVQYYGNVTWKTAQGPAAIVARKTYENTPKNVEFCIEIKEGEKMLDRTYVRLSDDDEVSNNFAFNEDMTKDLNGRKANIYTRTADNVAVAGNTMPTSDNAIRVPMSVVIRETTDFTIDIPDGTNGVGVTLIDNTTGIRTNLSALGYTINLEAGTYTDRFSLEISAVQDMPTDLDKAQSDKVQNDKAQKMLIDGVLYIVRDGKLYDCRGVLVH